MKKIETSKLLLLVAYTFAGLLTLAVIIGSFLNLDTSSLTIVASARWAELAVHTAVYSRKATMENKMKITTSMIQQISKVQKFDADTVVQLADSITREG